MKVCGVVRIAVRYLKGCNEFGTLRIKRKTVRSEKGEWCVLKKGCSTVRCVLRVGLNRLGGLFYLGAYLIFLFLLIFSK